MGKCPFTMCKAFIFSFIQQIFIEFYGAYTLRRAGDMKMNKIIEVMLE